MKHLSLTPPLYEYMLDISLREHKSLASLRQASASMMLANMQSSPEQAQFLQFLIKTIRARKVLELGTFTGYSTLAMALALPDGGKLITCDINSEWTHEAPRFWEEAGVAHKIQLRLAPALETLQQLVESGQTEQFDFIFIDADKTNYVPYYEFALQLINPQGLIAIDNIFWDGKVINANDTGAQTREIRRLNELLKHDKRVDVSLLAIGDGLFLVRRTDS